MQGALCPRSGSFPHVTLHFQTQVSRTASHTHFTDGSSGREMPTLFQPGLKPRSVRSAASTPHVSGAVTRRDT